MVVRKSLKSMEHFSIINRFQPLIRRYAKRYGVDIDDFAPQLSFFFYTYTDIFEEAAKYRAARRLWARLLIERYEAKNPRGLWLRFHAQTAGCDR